MGAARQPSDRPGLRERLTARLRDRLDSEHEQILVRLGIAVAALLYLIVASQGDGAHADAAAGLRPLAAAYALASVLLLAHLLASPAANPPRRLAGLATDLATLTIALLAGGSAGAVFWPFYLWITFGMGLRYGQRYLLISAGVALASFALVIATTPYWQAQPALAAGLWAALIALPAYTSKLLDKLTRAIARANAANSTKSRFLTTISHELRTPLHAVLASADLLDGTPLDQEQKSLVGITRTSGRSLLAMIDDLLEVATVGEGRHEQGGVFDLHQLLATVSEQVRLQALAKGLAFRVRVDPEAPFTLCGPRRALEQILLNLLGNAVKFTAEGAVDLALVTVLRLPGKVRLRLEVRDTGIGIPAEARERIFERFTQADQSTTRRFGGTGLGLAIAHQLAESIGGSLGVDSTPGHGSTFMLEVPLEVASQPAADLRGEVLLVAPRETFAAWRRRIERLGALCQPAYTPHVEPGDLPRALLVIGADAVREDLTRVPLVVVVRTPDEVCREALCILPEACSDEQLGNALHAALARPALPETGVAVEPSPPRRVLVAEDNRTNRQVIERVLARGGHRVTLVEDGEAALDALEAEPFDLVLMDLNMPVLGGIDAVKLYRVTHRDEQAPVFAALTADVTEATRRSCAEAGIDAFVTKPVEPSQLLALVAHLTADRGRRRVPSPALQAATAARPATAAPVLDPVHLQSLRALDEDDSFLQVVLRDFLDDAQTLVSELESAAQARDAARFRDRAHALRSSAAYVGASALFELCREWRGIGTAELESHGPAHMARLRTEFHRLEQALTAAMPGTAVWRPPAGDQLETS